MPTPLPTVSDDLFEAFFDLSLVGGILFAPVLDAAGEVADFTYARLNPAAQQMLALPERPAESFLTRYPHARPTGIFAFYRAAYLSGEARHGEFNYQHDGLDNYFHLAARRVGEQLLVSFTDTSEQPRTAVEQALRDSQAREQMALAEVEAEHQRLHQLLMRMPAHIALLRGPAHIYALVNPEYEQLFPGRPTLGRSLREVVPELQGQGFYELLDRVYATGEPYYEAETEAWADFAGTGELERRYYRTAFEPIRNAQGQVTEVLNFAVDVTAQVESRRRAEQLAHELEARVLARTRELEAARAATERQRQQWEQLFRNAPAAICIFDGPAWVYEFVNPGYQAMFPGRALLGKPLLEALPEVAGTPLVDILRRVYDTGEPFNDDEVLVPLARTEGGPIEDIYFDLTYQARRNAAGQIDGFVTYAYDVTEQVLARREREAHQQQLSRILSQVPAAVATFSGPEHRFTFFNDDYQAIVAGRAQLGLTLAAAVPEAVAQGFLTILDGVYASGQPFVQAAVPAQLLDPATGSLVPHYVDLSYQPLLDVQGHPVGILAFVLNVTASVLARRQAETMQAALLAAAQRQVQQREELFQVFEQAPAAIVLLREPDHRIEYVNPAYAQLFPGVALRGRLMVEAHPNSKASGIITRLDRVYETGEPYVGEEQPVELTLTPGQPARTHYFNFTYQPYREDGRIVGVSIFAYDVTDSVLARRAVTQALEQQRGELQRIFEQAPIPITVLRGPELVVESANAAISALWGRPVGQLLGRPYFEAVPDTAGQGFEEILAGVLETGQSYFINEMPVALDRAHTGRPLVGNFNFEFKALYGPDEAAGPVGLLAVGIEVTDQVVARQQVEQLNQELEARVLARTRQVQEAQAATERERALLQALLTQAPVAIGLFQGEEIRVTAANSMMAALWGYTPEQVVGRPLLEGVPELRGQGFDDLLRQVLTTQVPYVGTEAPATMLRAGQLKTTYYNFVYQPLYNAEGEVLGVIDVATEVTEQVEARRQVEQLNQELEARVLARTRELSEQQALLRQILGQVPASIATLSGPEHRFSFFNELYQSLAAGRAELGFTVAEVFPEVLTQGFIGLLDQVYLTGEPFVGTDMPIELYDAQLGHNQQHYVDFIYQPLFDGQRRVQGILAFILDVTDRALARQQAEQSRVQVQELNEELGAINEELRATNEELHESNRRLMRTNTDLDTFVYTASHDLKAPITNIEGLLNALRDYLPAEADPAAMVPRLLGMMDGAVARFLQTIGHLTDVSRLQNATQEPAEAVALAALIRDVRLDLEPLIEATRAQLLVDLADCSTVYFSPKNLRSIVYNLLSNALKYRDPARALVVELRAYRQAGQVALEVHDNGLGLTQAQQTRLFGLFQRLHTHVEGTGVGLYMLKKIVENAGGTITVHSQPGAGSTFTVLLPAQP